jgi:hypothetical protein
MRKAAVALNHQGMKALNRNRKYLLKSLLAATQLG